MGQDIDIFFHCMFVGKGLEKHLEILREKNIGFVGSGLSDQFPHSAVYHFVVRHDQHLVSCMEFDQFSGRVAGGHCFPPSFEREYPRYKVFP